MASDFPALTRIYHKKQVEDRKSLGAGSDKERHGVLERNTTWRIPASYGGIVSSAEQEKEWSAGRFGATNESLPAQAVAEIPLGSSDLCGLKLPARSFECFDKNRIRQQQ